MRRSSPRNPVARPSRLACELAEVYFDLMMQRVKTLRALAAQNGLSPVQLRTLLQMEPDRPSMMSEVAEAAGCGPSNLTGIIDKLEARGWVERRSSPQDRRIKMLALTQEGAALREGVLARAREPTAWMLSLTSIEQRRLRDLLRKATAFEDPDKADP
jgi:DNA-binding MarR family transcriptional regulator